MFGVERNHMLPVMAQRLLHCISGLLSFWLCLHEEVLLKLPRCPAWFPRDALVAPGLTLCSLLQDITRVSYCSAVTHGAGKRRHLAESCSSGHHPQDQPHPSDPG